MKARWLGWAGVEIEAEGESVVIDPLADPGATFAALGEWAARAELPEVVGPRADRSAHAGMVSHLHRDHADAGALAAALADDAVVFEPVWPGGEDVENLALAQANWELERAQLRRRQVQPWETVEVGPFTLTALPAVDGLGDPQISWVVETPKGRVLHLGDTLFHGYWWRMARRHGPFDLAFVPVNGPAVDFPHLRPASSLAAAMDPEQAAQAIELLGAAAAVPFHHSGFAIAPWYRPVDDAAARFAAAAAARPYEVLTLRPGEAVEVGSGATSVKAA